MRPFLMSCLLVVLLTVAFAGTSAAATPSQADKAAAICQSETKAVDHWAALVARSAKDRAAGTRELAGIVQRLGDGLAKVTPPASQRAKWQQVVKGLLSAASGLRAGAALDTGPMINKPMARKVVDAVAQIETAKELLSQLYLYPCETVTLNILSEFE